MTDTDQQITPADATIVSTGTGTKGPEERELPESLSNDISLCLRILRDVLGEYDPQLLATFDTVRNYAVKASAEHFAGATADPHPDEDGLAKAVATIDAMNLHDAQLLARAFATYFHLANLSEENYRVSVLHQRENQVEDDEAVDPVNELTTAYHQLLTEMGPAKAKALLEKLEFHPVFTAHPTEARRKAVEGKIRRIAELLEENKRLGGSDNRRAVPHVPDRAEEADAGRGGRYHPRHLRQHAVHHDSQGLPPFQRLAAGRQGRSRTAAVPGVLPSGKLDRLRPRRQPERHRQGQPSGRPQVQRPCDQRP